jgi:adenylosuccinate synthase
VSVCCVVGGQFGSEGKGAVVGHIATEYEHHVRIGAANAGHTVYTLDSYDTGVEFMGAREAGTNWNKHVLQQIPCAAYANPKAMCYIGPGALITPDILGGELDENAKWRDYYNWDPIRLLIDPRAQIITAAHIHQESRSDLEDRIGSTSATASEGIGAAQAARVMRDESCLSFGEYWRSGDPRISSRAVAGDVPRALGAVLDAGEGVLLEGTQGYGLSNTLGYFPYVTSRGTTSAALLEGVGLSPRWVDRVIVVVRSYPIRVAGNSGPFHAGSVEMSWSDIGVDEENERTTVTKKVRRVGSFSHSQVAEACRVNGATEVALMFADYMDPKLAGQVDPARLADAVRTSSRIRVLEQGTGVPVTLVGTGPHTMIDRRNVYHVR